MTTTPKVGDRYRWFGHGEMNIWEVGEVSATHVRLRETWYANSVAHICYPFTPHLDTLGRYRPSFYEAFVPEDAPLRARISGSGAETQARLLHWPDASGAVTVFDGTEFVIVYAWHRFRGTAIALYDGQMNRLDLDAFPAQQWLDENTL